MILTDEHGNVLTRGHSLEGLRHELAKIPLASEVAAMRLVDRFAREIAAVEAYIRANREWERAHGYPPVVAMGGPAVPPPRSLPAPVLSAALEGFSHG